MKQQRLLLVPFINIVVKNAKHGNHMTFIRSHFLPHLLNRFHQIKSGKNVENHVCASYVMLNNGYVNVFWEKLMTMMMKIKPFLRMMKVALFQKKLEIRSRKRFKLFAIGKEIYLNKYLN